MEFKTTGELSGVAEIAPQLFMDASLGRGEYEGEAFNREPGIQLTKEQIISLRKYETLGLSLPVEIGSIRDYLRYGEGDSGGIGLRVEDFQKTFRMTFDHAARWRPLREKIMQTGTDLDVFSARILLTGGDIVETYDKLEISGFLKEHGIDTIEEYLKLKDQMPDIPSIEVPEGVVDDIGYYLGIMLDDIKKCHAAAEVVRDNLDSFGADMRTLVLPEIKQRMWHVSENGYATEIEVLQKQIDERADRIDELNKQYDELVKQAIASAIVSPVGIIVGIFLGVKAEKIRRDRNILRLEQSVDNKLMASKNQTLSSLNRVRDDLQNLNYVAIEAEVATQNLMLVWNSLSLFIASSVEDLHLVEEATKLSRLISAIKRVVKPWEDVKNNTDPLLEVFRAADREYEEDNARYQARSAFMLAVSDFSMDQLVDHNGVVQDADVTAQVLSQKFSYLPGPVGTMHTLAGSIREKTYGVKVQCQEIDIKLERCADNLEWLLEDLVDTAEDDDIPAKIEAELQTARGILSERSGKFIGWKRDISGRFDRALSKQWVATLENDKAYAQEQKAKAEEKLSELTTQLKSVLDAIDLIEEAGIEKIGKEVQLSLENLKALGLAPPQILIAQFALDTLKKLISGIGHAISYLNMLDAYKTLQERAAGLRAQRDQHDNDFAMANGKISLVEALEALDDGRWEYVNEFSKLVDDVEALDRDFVSDKTLPIDERAKIAIGKISEITEYVKSVYR